MNKEIIGLYSSAALDRLGQLGAALFGLSVFAYIAGYFKLKNIYEVVGAGWAIDFVLAEEILRAGLGPMALFGLAIASCMIMIGSGDLVKSKIITFLVVTAGIQFALHSDFLSPEQDLPSVFVRYNTAYAITNFLYSATGALLVYCAYRAILKGVDGMVVFMAALSLMFGLYVSPVYLGKSWGKAAIADDPSFLPWVAGADENDMGWRLIGNVGGKYLLMSNRALEGDAFFILVDVGAEWKIIKSISLSK